ncbi:MAG: hypothetical protein K2Y71_18005 [Xanthobacteraceae bacterium]|nr:hypothetical protein [Xanthobacteraceae bacterium]
MISGNLFTRDYLLDGIDRTAQWKGLTDKSVSDFRNRLKAIAGKFLKIAKPNEAETEKEFIYPVIEALGWSDYQVQQILSQKGRKQVPDALLFADDAAKSLAVAEAQQWKRFQHGLAVLEAKRWNRALDRADKRDPSEEGVPSTQMLQYLSRVDVQTNNKVRLGILTNGNVWRLYFQGALSVSEDFLEIDLAQALELPGRQINLLDHADARLTSDRVLRLFILFFGKAAFLPIEGPRTFHDLSREAGKTWEEKSPRTCRDWSSANYFPNSSRRLRNTTQRAARRSIMPISTTSAKPRSSCSIVSCLWSMPRTAICCPINASRISLIRSPPCVSTSLSGCTASKSFRHRQPPIGRSCARCSKRSRRVTMISASRRITAAYSPPIALECLAVLNCRTASLRR